MINISKDKYLHFAACTVVSLLVGIFGNLLFNMNCLQAMYAGLSGGILIGIGKEYGDKVNPNNVWDWKDILADVIGALFGAIVTALLYLL